MRGLPSRRRGATPVEPEVPDEQHDGAPTDGADRRGGLQGLPGRLRRRRPAEQDEAAPGVEDLLDGDAEADLLDGDAEADARAATGWIGRLRTAQAGRAAAKEAARAAFRGTPADRFGLRDLVAEASSGIGGRPGRLLLTILGTVLGIASVVVTVGLAQTAAGQIARQFDAVAATQAMAEPATGKSASGDNQALARLPWDAPERVGRLAGVEAAGLVADVDVDGARITAVPVNDPSQPAASSPSVLAGTDGLLDAVRGDVRTGRFFDAGHDARADRVVVLGADAADRLGISRVDRQPSIFIGDRAYTVIGIIDGVQRRTDLLNAVVMPIGTARADFGLGAAAQLHMKIAVGAGPVVGEQVPVALDPNTPASFKVQVPPNASQVKENVQTDINAIFLALGGVALLVGGLGIANVTLLSVMERIGEIGLRRALGATRRNIGSQFMLESVVVGLLGGLIGAALGVAVVVIVSAAQSWSPLLDMGVVAGSALAGGGIGLVAGIYPALKAASIEPITALRGGV